MANQGEILGLFPNVVARKEWSDCAEHNQTMKDLFYNIEKDFPMENKNEIDISSNYYTSYNLQLDKPLITYDELKPFVNFLSDSIRGLNEFMQFDGEYKFTIKNLWFAINRKYSFHEVHAHTPAIWSGVYYVQAQEDDAHLKLLSPPRFNNQWASHVIKQYNDFSNAEVILKTKTGLLHIFPGYLEHSVGQQIVNRDRIAISFNVV